MSGLAGVGIGLVVLVMWAHNSSSSMCIEISEPSLSCGLSGRGALVGGVLVVGVVDMVGGAVSCIVGLLISGCVYLGHLGWCMMWLVSSWSIL